VEAPILVRPDFEKPFCLDVDWSTKGVLSQREGRFEKVVAYASKGLIVAQRRFHPMEGECYALIWGIMHFRHYLQRTHFTLRTDHKPFEWLATVSNANGRRGRWIDMLQDFSFKILHRPRLKHGNVDALSRNPMGQAANDDDFSEEVQDDSNIRNDPVEAIEKMFSVRYGQDSDWFGFKRHLQGLIEHRMCCFGINHWCGSEAHQLFMLDVVTATNQEVVRAAEDEDPETTDGKQALRKETVRYYDKQ
jgi:hypothetical protein